MHKEKEIWEGVPNYEEYYLISSWGNVWSVRGGKMLSPSKNKKGYLRVRFSVKGLCKTFRIHRLVGLVFIDNPLDKPEINHNDFNKENNYYKNLKWVTGEENMDHYYEEYGYPDKSVIKKCLCGHEETEYNSISEASKIEGLSSSNISSALNGRSKTAGGYLWEFKK